MNPIFFRGMVRKLLAICLCVVFLTASTASAISIPDEQKLGKEFMEMVENQGVIIHDPAATHLINTVGAHILSTVPFQPFHFDFYLIDDDTFNAFASPSANIFVHRGLFSSLENIDEFAGILAHEIAHAVSRHVSQSIDRSKYVGIGTLAGMLAGVLLGASGGGEAASAITLGSMAAGQSSMLAFTRENETEADQKGVLFLDRTGYDPHGLLSSLTKIRAADTFGMENIPDYFKTHPGTGNRIAHLSGILADHKNPPDKPKPPETYDFQMVKYRIIGLYGDPDKYLASLQGALSRHPDDAALNYGMGLLSLRLRHMDLAESYLQKALAQRIFDPLILLELAHLNLEKGNYDKALAILQDLKSDPVLGNLATYYAAEAQIETGDFDGAEQGLTQVLKADPRAIPRANFHMAHIMARKDNDPMSHFYLGVYHSRTRDLKNAAIHLKRAVDTLTDDTQKKTAQKELDQVKKRIHDARQGS